MKRWITAILALILLCTLIVPVCATEQQPRVKEVKLCKTYPDGEEVTYDTYTYTYDKAGRVTEIDYWIDEYLAHCYLVYSYDKNGNLAKATSHLEYEESVEAYVYTNKYNWKKQLTSRTGEYGYMSSETSAKVTERMWTDTAKYTYDRSGRVASTETVRNDGYDTTRTVETYTYKAGRTDWSGETCAVNSAGKSGTVLSAIQTRKWDGPLCIRSVDGMLTLLYEGLPFTGISLPECVIYVEDGLLTEVEYLETGMHVKISYE